MKAVKTRISLRSLPLIVGSLQNSQQYPAIVFCSSAVAASAFVTLRAPNARGTHTCIGFRVSTNSILDFGFLAKIVAASFTTGATFCITYSLFSRRPPSLSLFKQSTMDASVSMRLMSYRLFEYSCDSMLLH